MMRPNICGCRQHDDAPSQQTRLARGLFAVMHSQGDHYDDSWECVAADLMPLVRALQAEGSDSASGVTA